MLGLAEAFLRDDFDIEGDIESAFELADVLRRRGRESWLARLRRVYHFAVGREPPEVPSSSPSMLTIHGDWPARLDPPPLSSGQIHVWRALVPESIPTHWTAVLNAEEQDRAARKRIPLDARRTLTSRACLRLLLGQYLRLAPTSVRLTATVSGKPQLADAPTLLEFNVSHSGDWVVFAFAPSLALGVDVEQHREVEFSELVNSFFSLQERESWSNLAGADQMSAFFSAWTRKEACVKALGVGLDQALDSFSVSIGSRPGAEVVLCAGKVSAQPWLIVPMELASGYSCAVAVDPAATAIHTFTLTLS